MKKNYLINLTTREFGAGVSGLVALGVTGFADFPLGVVEMVTWKVVGCFLAVCFGVLVDLPLAGLLLGVEAAVRLGVLFVTAFLLGVLLFVDSLFFLFGVFVLLLLLLFV